MKLIEFAYIYNDIYSLGLFDIADISTVEYLPDNSQCCCLILKDGRRYNVPGTYRGISNRFIYGLGKTLDPLQDPILRPSILFFHRPHMVEAEEAFFDHLQVQAFQKVLNNS